MGPIADLGERHTTCGVEEKGYVDIGTSENRYVPLYITESARKLNTWLLFLIASVGVMSNLLLGKTEPKSTFLKPRLYTSTDDKQEQIK